MAAHTWLKRTTRICDQRYWPTKTLAETLFSLFFLHGTKPWCFLYTHELNIWLDVLTSSKRRRFHNTCTLKSYMYKCTTSENSQCTCKTWLKRPLKHRYLKQMLAYWRSKVLQDFLLLNGQNYCRMLSWSILQYFWPALSMLRDNMSWKHIVGLLYKLLYAHITQHVHCATLKSDQRSQKYN